MKIKIELEEGEQMSAVTSAFDPNNVKCPACGEPMEIICIDSSLPHEWADIRYECPNCDCKTKLDASIDTFF